MTVEPITDKKLDRIRRKAAGRRAAGEYLGPHFHGVTIEKLIARIDLERNRADEAVRELALEKTRKKTFIRHRDELAQKLHAAERQLETAHTIMAINEQAYTERVCELHAAEAEVARLRAALESIVERHPDSTRGEHPAVDICLDALTGIDQRYPFHALAAPPDPKEPNEA